MRKTNICVAIILTITACLQVYTCWLDQQTKELYRMNASQPFRMELVTKKPRQLEITEREVKDTEVRKSCNECHDRSRGLSR